MTGERAKATEKSQAAMKAAVPEVAETLRLLAHPVRLLLLCEIARNECSVAALERTLGIRQPGLSQQLAELRQSGLVRTRRQARSVFYSIDDPRIKTLLDCLYAIFCAGEAAAPPIAAAGQVESRPRSQPTDSARFAEVKR